MSSPIDVVLMESASATPHQCAVCYKVFVSSKGLQQHSIIHTDRKPFSCEICGKPFRFKSNLFEHRSIHTGEQPFVCPFCGKACRLKGNLKKHLKTHVKESEELDRAYEAVTGSQNSSNENEEGEYYHHEHVDAENTPARKTPRRKSYGQRSKAKQNKMILMMRQQQGQEHENSFPMALSDYPPLTDMMSSDYSMLDFARAAQNVSIDRYDCRLCELTFGSRGEMRAHVDAIHDRGQPDTGLVWCDTCLRPFDDQQAAEQHANYHKRIRGLVARGELELNDMMVPVRF